jgi:Zn-dependent protease
MLQNFSVRLPEIAIQLLAFALALSFHESAHGWVAERLGDSTARWLGRITLNPIKHVDLFGTIIFPIALALVGAPVMGWAKPVPFVRRNLRDQRWGPALVGLAGPASNLLLATVATAILLVLKGVLPNFQLLVQLSVTARTIGEFGLAVPLVAVLFWFAGINLILAVFNLVPIPPLDGSHLLEAMLPPRLSSSYAELRPYGMLILLGLVWLGFFGYVLRPFLHALSWILLS